MSIKKKTAAVGYCMLFIGNIVRDYIKSYDARQGYSSCHNGSLFVQYQFTSCRRENEVYSTVDIPYTIKVDAIIL